MTSRYAASMCEAETLLLQSVMVETEGNVAAAARSLGLARTQLYKRLKRCGWSRPAPKRGNWGDLDNTATQADLEWLSKFRGNMTKGATLIRHQAGRL